MQSEDAHDAHDAHEVHDEMPDGSHDAESGVDHGSLSTIQMTKNLLEKMLQKQVGVHQDWRELETDEGPPSAVHSPYTIMTLCIQSTTQ